MRLCKNCSKKIPDSKRKTAEYCSGSCKTEFYRKTAGIEPPDFMSFSKPMDVTNQQRNALTVTQKNEHRILQAETGNLQKIFDDLLKQYTEYDRILREYELSGELPKKYRIYIDTTNPPKRPLYEPVFPYISSIPHPDLSKFTYYKRNFPRYNNGVNTTKEREIDTERTSEMTNKAIAINERTVSRNAENIANYEESKRVYDEEYALWEEYETYAPEDNGSYLGVKALLLKIQEVKDKLEGYTEEIALRKDIIRESYSEVELMLAKEAEEKALSISDPVHGQRITGKDVTNMRFKSYKFITEWAELLGEPSKPFIAMLYGDAKAGKSYFAMRLAQYLTMFGDVAYFAIEEGLSATTQQKIDATEAHDVYLEQATKIDEVVEALEKNNYKFAFIDSASALNMGAEDFKELIGRFPNISFIVILHTTKSNDFAGEKQWKHDVQMILEVTKVGLRTTKIQCTGRFGVSEKVITY